MQQGSISLTSCTRKLVQNYALKASSGSTKYNDLEWVLSINCHARYLWSQHNIPLNTVRTPFNEISQKIQINSLPLIVEHT